MAELSQYEIDRLKNLERNKMMLESLDLPELKMQITPPKKASAHREKKRKLEVFDETQLRRSSRIRGTPAPPPDKNANIEILDRWAAPERVRRVGTIPLEKVVSPATRGEWAALRRELLDITFVNPAVRKEEAPDKENIPTQTPPKIPPLSKRRRTSPLATVRTRSSTVMTSSPANVSVKTEKGKTEEGADEGDVAKALARKPFSVKYNNKLSYTHFKIDGDGGFTKMVPDRVYSISIHPSKDRILFAIGDKWGRVGMWDYGALDDPLADSGVVCVLEPHSKPVSGLQIPLRDVSKMYSCSYDGSVRCMDLEKEKSIEVYSSQDGYRTGLDIDNNTGNTIYCGCSDGSIAIIDVRTKTPMRYDLHEKKVSAVSVCPSDTNTIATSSNDRTVKIWDVRKIKKSVESWEHDQAISSVGFSQGAAGGGYGSAGRYLVSISYDNYIRVWDKLTNMKKIRHNNNTGRWVTPFRVAWDPKCEDTFAIGGMDRALEIFSASKGEHKAHHYSENLTAIPSINAFHPFHNVVVSATASGRAYIWK